MENLCGSKGFKMGVKGLYPGRFSCTFFLIFNLTSYSTTLSVISSVEGLEINGFEEVCGPEEVKCVYNGFRVVGESRRHERRDREGFSAVLERWA